MIRFIFPIGYLLVVLVLSVMLAGAQAVVKTGIMEWTIVSENVSCSVTSYSALGSLLQMNLDCAGAKASTTDTEVVVGYLQKPRPLVCTTYRAGDAKCRLSE